MKKHIYRSIFLLLTAYLGISTVNALEGSGADWNPYLIQTEEDLVWLSETGAGNWTHYKITKDLNMQGYTFYGIGSGANGTGQCTGIFIYGDTNVVANLTITPHSDGTEGVGFINRVGNWSHVLNLGFTNLTINASGYTSVGAIIGDFMCGGYDGAQTKGIISNCFINNSRITGDANVGGIVGRGRGGTVKDCHVNATITGKNVDAGVGGIFGLANEWGADATPIENVMVYGDISNGGVSNANALMGWPNGATAVTAAYYDNNLNVTDAFGTAVTDLENTSSYPEFDFTNIWAIHAGIGAGLLYVPPWSAPVAAASEDLLAFEGDFITVSGIKSTPSSDGTSVQYNWSTGAGYPTLNFTYRHIYFEWNVEGEIIVYDTTKQDSATFEVPVFQNDTNLMILLNVEDNLGFTSPNYDTVMVHVRTAADNNHPVIDGADDQTAQYSRPVTFAASATDADNDSVSYSWEVPEMIEVDNSELPEISFIAPKTLTEDSTFIFVLTVTDHPIGAQVKDTVELTVIANVKPSAIASAEATSVESVDLVKLEATNATDPNGDDIFYSWIAPEGIMLSDTTIAKPTFTAPNVSDVTDFVITLIVNDGILESDATSIKISVSPKDREHPPAGLDRNTISNVAVYPNPSNGLFTLAVDTDLEVQVRNILGKLVHTQVVYPGENQLDLSSQVKGIYFMNLIENNTQRTIKVKIW